MKIIPGRESGFAATAPMDFAVIPDKIADKIADEIPHWGKQNGSHFRLLPRKSTKRDVFSSVGATESEPLAPEINLVKC